MLAKILICFALSICLSNAFPKDIKKCKVGDDACVMEMANTILQTSFKGIDEIGLPSFDPLRIEKMNIVQGGNSSVQIDLKFRNVELVGLSKSKVYKVSGFKKDPQGNKLHFDFKTPLGTIVGPYVISGQILILPIVGDGNVTLNLINLDIHLKFLTKKVVREGKTYMEIEKSKFSYDVTGANVNFTNLFNGDKALGDNMNLLLNSQWRLLLDELQAPIYKSFAVVFKDALNSVFSKTPYDELFAQ